SVQAVDREQPRDEPGREAAVRAAEAHRLERPDAGIRRAAARREIVEDRTLVGTEGSMTDRERDEAPQIRSARELVAHAESAEAIVAPQRATDPRHEALAHGSSR